MVHSSRFLAAVLFALLWFPSAGFAQFFVNTPADLPDPDLADPTCGDPTTHLCSLRAAIMQANASAPACMTISLSDGLYAVGSDLAVTGCAIVTGVGAGPDCHIGGCRASATWTIIEAVPREWPLRSRIFDVRPSGELHLHDLILRGGDARRPDVWRTPPDSGHLGGAIFNMGHLGMSNVLFTENRAEIGGALFNWAFADLIEVEMTRNESTWNGRDGCGGALVNTGRITILRSFFNLNRSQGDGGAICHGLDGFFSTRDPEPPYFNMFDSTVAFNRAARNGGGLITHRNTRVNQVTIRGNTAEHGRGGGIDSHTGLNLLESTVTGNHALGGRRRVTGFPPSFQECFVCGLGGGVFSEADLLVDGTTIENNDVDRDGGGLYARTSAVVRRSALVRNMAANNGGGIFFQATLPGTGCCSCTAPSAAMASGGVAAAESTSLPTPSRSPSLRRLRSTRRCSAPADSRARSDRFSIPRARFSRATSSRIAAG